MNESFNLYAEPLEAQTAESIERIAAATNQEFETVRQILFARFAEEEKLNEELAQVLVEHFQSKNKITKQSYIDECGDGCCTEFGYKWKVNGEEVHTSPCEDSGWLKVLEHFGINAELIGVDEDDEESWNLNVR